MTTKFKFSLISDMHLDFAQPRPPYSEFEEWVIDAGDSSNGLGASRFFDKLKKKGHQVFAIDGNHTHYANPNSGRNIIETENRFFDLVGNEHFRHISEELCIIGYNGWYQIPDPSLWISYMNDLRCGDETQIWDASERHVSGLRNTLRSWPGKAIVVTHTAPCIETLNPAYDGHFSNDWYWNPGMRQVLSDFSDKILVWCHGHTHAAADKIIDGVRVVANPRGYPGENPNWKPLTIEVET